MIEIVCPHCHQSSAAEKSMLGQSVACGVCEKEFVATSKPDSVGDTAKAGGNGCFIATLVLATLAIVGIVAGGWYLMKKIDGIGEIPMSEEDRREQEAALEQAEQVKAKRKEVALAFRDEVLDHKWDRLFEEKLGTPTEIEIDPSSGIETSPWKLSLSGLAWIDGKKYTFRISFKTKGGKPDGPMEHDRFHLSEWKPPEPPKPVASIGDQTDAWAYIQLFVERQLKSPKDAKFPFGGHRDVEALGDGRFKVRSYVDATNSFGAQVRTRFECVVKRRSGGWDLESLEFDPAP